MARKSRTNPNGSVSGSSSTKSKPKRIRRKCSAPNCANRVVQGGVCVTHGAKRKLCAHPSCDKAVKLAGYCSTHGPARRKCDDESGCTRVAVQGGKCLSHGARRRVCCYPLSAKGGEKCAKNAIMGGMCKKHYDRVQEAEGMLEMSLCVPIAQSSSGVAAAGVAAASSVSGGSASAMGSGGESEEEESLMTLGSSPSRVGAAAVTVTSAPPAVSQPVAIAVPSSSATFASSGYGHHGHRRSKKMKPSHHGKGHQRGLSIFDEMQTVNAIISSGAENQPSQPPAQLASQPPLQIRTSATYPPRYPQASSHSSTKTPTTQVSFADSVPLQKGATGTAPAAKQERESPCTGDASCSCNACRSPTLAIFEQMIQASQKLETDNEDNLDKYAGLSPPKLNSPRKSNARMGSFTGRDVAESTTQATPKNVGFLPEEPTSTGSVIRKVSCNNIVGESWGGANNADASAPQAANHGGVPEGQVPYEYRQDMNAPQDEDGPASHALAAAAVERDDEGVSRTVSHDVDDNGRYNHHYSSYYPYHSSHTGHAAPPPASQYPHAPTYLQQAPPPPQYHPDASAAYQLGQQSYSLEHMTLEQRPPSAPYYPHDAATNRAAFHPPQTPALYDTAGAPEERPQPMAIVSTHSTGYYNLGDHEQSHLLPRRREAIEHLFIPKEV